MEQSENILVTSVKLKQQEKVLGRRGLLIIEELQNYFGCCNEAKC